MSATRDPRKPLHTFFDLPRPSPKPSVSSLIGSDVRISSTDSLGVGSEGDARRRLLIVYIHGFLGNDDSFHSFPVHVHKCLREKLAATHVIHSKIYPRYKTYKAFHLARDNFSKWLCLHESPSTDIVLVGHSMGGLLAADVVLMNQTSPSSSGHVLKHRILGTVNMDVPFLGVQNSVIMTGMLSPFRSAKDVPDATTLHEPLSQIFEPPSPNDSRPGSLTAQTSTTSSYEFYLKSRATIDPNFDPHFPNDVRIQDRGWWQNLVHFTKKHKPEGLMHASFRHLKAHFDFGSCLLDSQGLKSRYNNLRKLEEGRPINSAAASSTSPSRCRFVQFYTVCYKDRAKGGSSSGCPTRLAEMPNSTDSTTVEQREDGKSTQTPANGDGVAETARGKERMFCKLGRQKGGQVDTLWRRVTMTTTDEVSAHTSIFMSGPHYDGLVNGVSETIARWVSDSML